MKTSYLKPDKVFLFYLYTFILVVFIYACSKDKDSLPINEPPEADWREPFEGDYKFTIINTLWVQTGYLERDTSETEGTVEKWKKDRMLIKYKTGQVYGLFVNDTVNYNFFNYGLCAIPDSMLYNPQSCGWYEIFWGYYLTWVSPVIHEDTTLKIPFIIFNPYRAGLHETFGGYFTGCDTVYFGYSSGGQGAGTYTDIYGVKVTN